MRKPIPIRTPRPTANQNRRTLHMADRAKTKPQPTPASERKRLPQDSNKCQYQGLAKICNERRVTVRANPDCRTICAWRTAHCSLREGCRVAVRVSPLTRVHNSPRSKLSCTLLMLLSHSMAQPLHFYLVRNSESRVNPGLRSPGNHREHHHPLAFETTAE
jgi:hypothetical protein